MKIVVSDIFSNSETKFIWLFVFFKLACFIDISLFVFENQIAIKRNSTSL